MEYIKFIFTDFPTFVGCFLLIGVAARLVLYSWKRLWDAITIVIHGYPPSHCSVTGKLKKEKKVKISKEQSINDGKIN